MVSLYAADGGALERRDCQVEALTSVKAHKRWVSEVQFPSVQRADPSTGAVLLPDAPVQRPHAQLCSPEGLLLLSSADDGSVMLSSIILEAPVSAAQVVPCASLAPHSKGIFSLHEVGGRVLTCSKDGVGARRCPSPCSLPDRSVLA